MEWQLWISIACIVAGLLLILLEVMNPGFLIAVPGTVLLGFGVAALIAPSVFYGDFAAFAIPIFGVPATIITIWGYKKWAPPGDKPITLSNDSLPGQQGTVVQAIPVDGEGKVRVAGQKFPARADVAIPTGKKIHVEGVDGFTLTVKEI